MPDSLRAGESGGFPVAVAARRPDGAHRRARSLGRQAGLVDGRMEIGLAVAPGATATTRARRSRRFGRCA